MKHYLKNISAHRGRIIYSNCMNIISFVMIRINFLQTFLSNYNVDTPVSLGLIKLCFSILLARCWLNRLIKYKFCEIAKLII